MPELHRRSSITGNPDSDCDINLGAESPTLASSSTNLSGSYPIDSHLDAWTKSGIASTTDIPTRPRDWRSESFSQKQQEHPPMRKEVDRDCGICFEVARSGRRTPCCRSLFCLEHITEWLNGPSSNGKCPNCGTPCAIKNGNISVASTPHAPPQLAHTSSYVPSPLPSPYSGPHETTVDVNPIAGEGM